jgi:hypothetical protein
LPCLEMRKNLFYEIVITQLRTGSDEQRQREVPQDSLIWYGTPANPHG